MIKNNYQKNHELFQKLNSKLEYKINLINKSLLDQYYFRHFSSVQINKNIEKELFFISKNIKYIKNLKKSDFVQDSKNNSDIRECFTFPSYNTNYSRFFCLFSTLLKQDTKFKNKTKTKTSQIINECDVIKNINFYNSFIKSLINRFNKKHNLLKTERKLNKTQIYLYKQQKEKLILKLKLERRKSIQNLLDNKLDYSHVEKYDKNTKLLTIYNKTYFFDTITTENINIKITKLDKQLSKLVTRNNLITKKENKLTTNKIQNKSQSKNIKFNLLQFIKRNIENKHKLKLKIIRNKNKRNIKHYNTNLKYKNIKDNLKKYNNYKTIIINFLKNTRKKQIDFFISKKLNEILVKKYLENEEVLFDENQDFFFDNDLIDLTKNAIKYLKTNEKILKNKLIYRKFKLDKLNFYLENKKNIIDENRLKYNNNYNCININDIYYCLLKLKNHIYKINTGNPILIKDSNAFNNFEQKLKNCFINRFHIKNDFSRQVIETLRCRKKCLENERFLLQEKILGNTIVIEKLRVESYYKNKIEKIKIIL